MSVAIVTDSTAYLPLELVASQGIRVVPLHVVLGGKQFSEGVDVTTAEVAADIGEEDLQAQVLARDKIAAALAGKVVRKVIVRPPNLVNIVTG